MVPYSATLTLLGACGLLLQIGCGGSRSTDEAPFSAGELPVAAGGRPAIYLRQARSTDKTKPQIFEAQILPGRGMNTYQLRAYVPGKGDVDVLVSPQLEQEVGKMQGGSDDFNGNETFRVGGAILLPFANRIRGKVSADGKTIETTILGKTVTLPANWQGKLPGAEKHAMHGLILASKMDDVKTQADATQASVTANLNAGNFQGHWPSQASVTITDTLNKNGFGFTVEAKNVGQEPMPIGIGWHPYFNLPSGDRQQVRLSLPANMRVIVNNYDDVFPTGEFKPVAGTPHDVRAPHGLPLHQIFMDDCFTDIEADANGRKVVTVTDPEAKYGVRISTATPQVKAFQVYAPVEKNFVAIEPQFNLGDPFNPIWAASAVDSGMVTLKPGESVTYAVNVEVFVP